MNEITRYNHGVIEQRDQRPQMSMDEVTTLLQLAASDDKRTIGYAEKQAWRSAAEIAGWTFEEASWAIRQHQATNTEYLKAAHITALVTSRRRRANLQGGQTEDGAKIPSLKEAVQLWVDACRSEGFNPTDKQLEQATTLLEQMLLPDGQVSTLLIAVVFSGRRGTARIDWVLEKVRSGKGLEGTEFMDVMWNPDLIIPVEYLPDSKLNVEYAIGRPTFPLGWRFYDPIGDRIQGFDKGMLLREYAAASNAGKLPDYEPQQRRVPDWVVAFIDDVAENGIPKATINLRRPAEEREEHEKRYERYRSRRADFDQWLKDDRQAWETERLPIVRQWYLDHPDDRREDPSRSLEWL